MEKCSACINKVPGLESCFLLVGLCGNDANWMNYKPNENDSAKSEELKANKEDD